MTYQRKNLRAPIVTFLLFEDEGYVHKAKLANISKGGALISQLPHFPSVNIVGTLLDIPQLPVVKTDDLEKLQETALLPKKRTIFRTRLRTVRRTTETSSVADVFSKNIGSEFVDMPLQQDLLLAIDEYIANYSYNLIFLLRLLDSNVIEGERLEKIQILSEILGHEKGLKVPILGQKVINDYKSLQW
ncbi:MAG: hypothetical protein HQK53_10940 [Oligoflexia bacterium]|nr:hypothetical protein [Oligoflexia bacterium]